MTATHRRRLTPRDVALYAVLAVLVLAGGILGGLITAAILGLTT